MAHARKRHLEARWFVVKDTYDDNGNEVRDEHCIFYGSEAEANDMLAKLNAGCDPSYFDAANEPDAFLYVDTCEIEL